MINVKSPVIIKSFPDGISIILDDKLPFPQLLEEVKKKFRESSKFFKAAKIVLAFEGRDLTDEEEKQMVIAIDENTDLFIMCVLERDEKKNEMFLKAANQYLNDGQGQGGQFYKGTLKSGQTLETDSSIIVLGDINPGAQVISKGNIVVLGTLYGKAYAGGNGNSENFISALVMQPTQLRIGDYILECDGSKPSKWLRQRAVPKIAYAKDETIQIEPITKELLNDIPL